MWEETCEGKQYRELLVTVWDQLSELMISESDEVIVYELFNEPEPKTDIDPNENKGYLWYDLQDDLINTIRENNDTHLVVATPAYSWRTESISEWIPSEIVLNDKNLIASVHGYRPIQFTIQEEAWYGNVDYNVYPGIYDEEHYGETYWDYEQINNMFADNVGDFYNEYGVQVYIAEFAVNREAPGADLWLLDMMNLMNKEYSDEIWGWSVHVWEEDQYARLNHLNYDWSRAGMNDFSADADQLEVVIAGMNNTEETLME
jgi:aryl-phospho-beta-D-glucosidase BglC (GH1 family)